MEQTPNTQPKQIQVKAKDEDLKGHYSNVLNIAHNRNEFILDFLMIHPPMGQLTARIITNPGHMKRIIRAAMNNIEKYEMAFGTIEESSDPSADKSIGFGGQ